MKAAAGSKSQLFDRIEKFKKIKMRPIVELFLPGFRDITGNSSMLVENCFRFGGCRYLVHFPIYDVESGYIYDGYDEKTERVELLLDFCKRINADALIMHRCCGFDREIKKKEAEEKFLEKLILWNRLAEERGMRILIENYGFVWLPELFGREYAVSPLDHFFPWDISQFNRNITEFGLGNSGVILDLAHAVLSSNMFNMLKKHPQLSSDRRFANIYPDDLDKKGLLQAGDFIFDFIDYFHISDSFVWHPEDGLSNLKKYLYTENLPIGEGNIDYKEIFKDISEDKTIVMEIDPGNDDHSNNLSQLEAIEKFEKFFN